VNYNPRKKRKKKGGALTDRTMDETLFSSKETIRKDLVKTERSHAIFFAPPTSRLNEQGGEGSTAADDTRLISVRMNSDHSLSL